MNAGTVVIIFTSYLGLWAIVNIGYFLLKAQYAKKDTRYHFFEMGAIWNIVNVIIAFVAVRFGITNYTELSQNGALAETQLTILAISIFADFAYITLGALTYLVKPKNRSSRRAGWGLAIMAQGTFLLALDAKFIASLWLVIR